MDVDEYVMHKVVADRLREARAAAAGRAMLGSRAALGGSLAGVYLDRLLLAFTRGVRLRIAGTVVLGLFQVVVGIARLALLGWLLARVFQGASLAELTVPLVLTSAAIVARGLLEYARTVMAHRTAAIVQARLRQTIYDHVVALGPAHVAGTRTGEIIVSMIERRDAARDLLRPVPASSRTASRPCATLTASSCSTRGAWWRSATTSRCWRAARSTRAALAPARRCRRAGRRLATNERVAAYPCLCVTMAEGSREHSRTTLKFRHREGQTTMNATKGFVVPAGGGKHLDMRAPGRFAALKLLGHETNESIMLFEETVPVGTKSLFHRHRDSDEVAWVLAGEITFKIGDEVSVGGPGTCAFFPRNVPHAWKSTGRETGRVLFLYTPAAAGGYVEELLKRPAGSIDDDERNKLRERYRWEVVGPNPL